MILCLKKRVSKNNRARSNIIKNVFGISLTFTLVRKL